MSAASVLRALPRRVGLRADVPPLPLPERVVPSASAAQVAWRSLRWMWVGGLTLVRITLDGARGRRGLRAQAARLREAFEELGGPAIKLGQQLSIRVDLLPFEVCDELALLMDQVPPFPWEEARAILQAELGRPPEELFEAISAQPIGAASIAAVWKGTLPGGEQVAIKVQRPNVAAQFAADLAAFDLMTLVMELLTLVRPGFFANMRSELKSMFLEELDFRAEARYQTLYREALRRDRLDWAVVPRVHRALSAQRVIVTDFVRAVPMTEVLKATDAQDEAALAALAADGIQPATLAERVMVLSMWGRFEAPLFHADPHPANLLVLPGSQVVLLDFGACGVTSRRSARNNEEILRRLNLDEDVLGVATVAVYELSPLPGLSHDDLLKETERKFAEYFTAAQAPGAKWYEKTSAGLWVKMLEVSQRHQIGLNLDTLRMMRSTLLYDSLAYRLFPGLPDKVYSDYLSAAGERRERRAKRSARVRPKQAAAASSRELPERAERVGGRLELAFEQLDVVFKAATSLSAYLTLLGVRLTSFAMALGVLASLRFIARELWPQQTAALSAALVVWITGLPSLTWAVLGVVLGLGLTLRL
ncbi:AarF/ABC1/UbiB kinase family protein, partial [Myxococcota bacterium]|nr:AarF/ABC1/UbiB kinase family protein [Myxococcota bacterium]